MEGDFKEVYFNKFCRSCENFRKKEDEEPCNSCLAEPAKVDSHKPVNYKKKERK